MAYYYCFPPESSNSIMTVGTTHENEVISMKHKFQISESIRLGAILALSGGFMDAYSYMERGEVFANAQTGNMLLFFCISPGKQSVTLFFDSLQTQFLPLFSCTECLMKTFRKRCILE